MCHGTNAPRTTTDASRLSLSLENQQPSPNLPPFLLFGLFFLTQSTNHITHPKAQQTELNIFLYSKQSLDTRHLSRLGAHHAAARPGLPLEALSVLTFTQPELGCVHAICLSSLPKLLGDFIPVCAYARVPSFACSLTNLTLSWYIPVPLKTLIHLHFYPRQRAMTNKVAYVIS